MHEKSKREKAKSIKRKAFFEHKAKIRKTKAFLGRKAQVFIVGM
jgi:hypothetical protein